MAGAPVRLVVASANPDKVAEIAAILGPGFDLVARPSGVPEVVEDATTLEGNARLKAVAICHATGLPSLADDTGLEVPALGGAPGVFSARFAGEGASYDDNVDKLLAELDRVGARAAWARRARFRTVALVHYPDGSEVEAEGVVDGTIAPRRQGSGGFGYDPVFVPDAPDGSPGDRSFGEMTPADKHAISHRGQAFRSLATMLV